MKIIKMDGTNLEVTFEDGSKKGFDKNKWYLDFLRTYRPENVRPKKKPKKEKKQ